MQTSLRGVAAGAALLLAAGVLAPTAGSAREPGPEPKEVPRTGEGLEAPPRLAAGVIVKYRIGAKVAPLRQAAEKAIGQQVTTTAVATNVRAFASELIPFEQAEAAAATLERDDRVEWAEPNGISYALADTPSPVPVTDPYSASLRNVWDMRGPENTSVTSLGVTPWPVGGYSTKAPQIWPATTGGGRVVAVIDTGIIAGHPDLAPNLVPGYDMVSTGPGATLISANDGDGRDADASDPGNWTTSNLCYSGQGAQPSSWHGTHVAGTIGAVANNGIGVVGVAPGVRIQPIRVLGRCGGSDADIAAAITWAAGVAVPGLPANATPASVINLSLGGQGTCSQVTQDAINAARGAGAVLVVALGNDNQPAAGYTPASCPGVIGVHSTSDYGDHASYSNYGPQADVSAPGGDSGWGENQGILSTVDNGTTMPAGPGYGWKEGTSMAAPAVAGAAAMIASVGSFSPDGLEAAVKAAVAGFPAGSTDLGFATCDTGNCGTGIVDMGKVPAPTSAPAITGAPAAGTVLTATGGSWIGPATARAFTWLANGTVVGTGPSYTVSGYDLGKSIVVREGVASGPFASIGATSTAMVVPAAVVPVVTPPIVSSLKKAKLKVSMSKFVSVSGRAKVKITLKVAGVKKPTGKITIKDGKNKVGKAKLKTKNKGKVTVTLPRLSLGKHKITVTFAGSSVIASATKTVTLVVRR